MRNFFFTRKSPTLAGEHTLVKFIRLHGLLNHDSLARLAPLSRSTHMHPRARPHNHPHDYHHYRRRRRFLSPSSASLIAPLFPPARPRPASAAAGNGSAYFIFKAGRIDNLQWRYVNAPSRTRATTAFFPPLRESFRMEKTVGMQSRIKGSQRLGKAEGFVGARSLGKVH